MNAELQKIDNVLTTVFPKKTYSKLSEDRRGRALVADCTNDAYCFDDISDSYFRIKISSADALLLRDNLYLFEFKRVINVSDPQKYKLIKNNLFLKISESLLVLDKKLMAPNNVNTELFKKYFILVVDSTLSPLTAMTGAMMRLSGGPTTRLRSFSDSFDKYRQIDTSGEYFFFDDVLIFNDLNFSMELAKLT